MSFDDHSHGAPNPEDSPPTVAETETPARPIRPIWGHLALAGVLLVAAGFRLWAIDQNGFGTDYYSACVRSMLDSWHNFFYASFDPGGFVSVDKPPVAFWIQAASAKLFGFHGLSVILPQVVEGLLSVLLVYHLVHRLFGQGAGLLAALALAVTPVSVAVDRGTNTDSCLVFVLLLSAWALTRAAETGSWHLLWLAAALVGVAFNVKMLAAFVVLPTFYLVYLLGAPINWRMRIGDLVLAVVAWSLVGLSWPVVYDLTPPDERPYAGSSKENSMLELAIGHNGVERFVRRGRGPALVRERPAPGIAPHERPATGSRSTAMPPQSQRVVTTGRRSPEMARSIPTRDNRCRRMASPTVNPTAHRIGKPGPSGVRATSRVLPAASAAAPVDAGRPSAPCA